MKAKLAVFDLDGTLYDTSAVNFTAYKQALEDEGYEISQDFFERECFGKYYLDFLPLIIPNPTSEQMERVHNRKTALYSDCLGMARENSLLFDLICTIKERYYIALVTTASRKNCDDILVFFNRKELFDLIITHNDVENVKPHPEGFIKAMQHFNMSPQDTVIYEDSPIGIEAAIRSEASVLCVMNLI